MGLAMGIDLELKSWVLLTITWLKELNVVFEWSMIKFGKLGRGGEMVVELGFLQFRWVWVCLRLKHE